MKILFFSSYFAPETMAASFRATENAQIWNEIGNEVTVFTGYPNYPLGRIFDGYVSKVLSFEIIDGTKDIGTADSKIIKLNNRLVKYLANSNNWCLRISLIVEIVIAIALIIVFTKVWNWFEGVNKQTKIINIILV